jgi:hypothetical protein
MHTRSYIERVHAQVVEQQRQKAIQREEAAMAKPPCTTQHAKRAKPLDDQIVELMRTLPSQLRDRPWSMAELVQRLSGKYRDRPHGQQVGEALLRQGWKKERRYAAGWDGRRVWLAPTD